MKIRKVYDAETGEFKGYITADTFLKEGLSWNMTFNLKDKWEDYFNVSKEERSKIF